MYRLSLSGGMTCPAATEHSLTEDVHSAVPEAPVICRGPIFCCRFLRHVSDQARLKNRRHTLPENSLRDHLPVCSCPVTDVLRQLYSEAMAPEEIVALSAWNQRLPSSGNLDFSLSDLNQESPYG